jgi:hypothetical protein
MKLIERIYVGTVVLSTQAQSRTCCKLCADRIRCRAMSAECRAIDESTLGGVNTAKGERFVNLI